MMVKLNGSISWLKMIFYWKTNNTVWDKVPDIKKEIDSEPVYWKKFSKIKKKFYGDEATDFHDNQI